MKVEARRHPNTGKLTIEATLGRGERERSEGRRGEKVLRFLYDATV